MRFPKPSIAPIRYASGHPLAVAFVVVLVSLLVLFGLQLVWLSKLETVSAMAHASALNSFLSVIATETQYFYRETAERTLNLPASWFTQGRLDNAAAYWKKRPAPGVRRLFLVDFTREEFGSFFGFDFAEGVLRPLPSSDESLAMIVAANPFQMLSLRGRGLDAASISVDERNPEYRIVLNPIVDDDSRVVGVAGMIVDDDYLRSTLLPSTIRKVRAKFFPSAAGDDPALTVRDGSGRVVLRSGDEDNRDIAARMRLPFVFTDWELSLHSPTSTPEQFARTSFAFNVAVAALTAAVLVGGIAFALRAADRAMRLSAMKSDFVSNVSHELRTPLASIRVFAEFLKSGRAASAEKVREYGEFIEAESRRLSRLIENILDFSRIESGRKEYRFARTDLRDVVDGAIRMFDVRLRGDGFDLTLEAPPEPLPPVRGDADALGQAIHNLLDNAVKYSGDAKEIRVRLERRGDDAVIAVSDRGIGLPPEERDRIFDRFHRVASSLVHDVKGAGLGLSIVRHVVEAHGGRIEVSSKPGHGSTFSIHLPISGPEA